MDLTLHPIGIVRSRLTNRDDCPHQGYEGAPQAWIEVDPRYVEGIDGLKPGAQIIVLTWMHLADRSVLRVHPRGDQGVPLTGVFKTRSPDRPNPIGLHKTTIIELESGSRVLVKPLEAVDGTPVIDIKCVLSGENEE
jgi:tRNA-Thr(GGU) m(6)t(6)A37 methyltransferase TsaA